MKAPLETAKRWLAQAEHSLNATRILMDNGLWSDVCFHAEQTAQLALKAVLFGRGRRFVNIHSIRALVLECSQGDPACQLKQECYRRADDSLIQECYRSIVAGSL
ncbi:MAG: HEPN domain-containing protein [SAR202 cluster bacterium]|nr:HEPN domain-containing protein [SAR202 cluster bacterium]